MNGINSAAVLQRAEAGWYGPHRPHQMQQRDLRRLSPQAVVDLLENASYSAHHRAGELLHQMQHQPWRLVSTAQPVAEDGQKVADTNTERRITLSVGGRPYHLACQDLSRLQVVKITA